MSIFWLSLLACGDKDTVLDSGITEDTTSEEQGPVEPGPFTLTVTGDQKYQPSPSTIQLVKSPMLHLISMHFGGHQLEQHTFVLRVMLRGDYQGAGTYTLQDNELTVTLQEEAGGEGRYFSVNQDDGHDASVNLQTEGSDIVWGTPQC